MNPRKWPFTRRLGLAVAAAYLVAFALELLLGGSRLDAVGWRDPWFPLSAEGFLMGLFVGGWPGAVLAALPFLLTPETVRWVRDALVDVARGETFLGTVALLYVVPLLLVIYAAAAAGAATGWVLWGRRKRS